MFDSLSDRIKEDSHAGVKSSEVVVKWAAICVISVFLFGCLFLAVKFLQ
jgi:hypothetical protein